MRSTTAPFLREQRCRSCAGGTMVGILIGEINCCRSTTTTKTMGPMDTMGPNQFVIRDLDWGAFSRDGYHGYHTCFAEFWTSNGPQDSYCRNVEPRATTPTL